MEEQRLKEFFERLEVMSRDYAGKLGTKADEVEDAAQRWQRGEEEARGVLIDRVHRLVSAGSFGFNQISDSAMQLETRLVGDAALSDIQSELDEFIALVRSKSQNAPGGPPDDPPGPSSAE